MNVPYLLQSHKEELYLDWDVILNRYRVFESHLIDNTQDRYLLKNPLYKILGSYLKVRCKIDNQFKHDQVEKNVSEDIQSVWIKDIHEYVLKGECADKKTVYKVIQSELACCNHEKLENIKHQLEKHRTIIFETSILDNYEATHLKTEIELAVQDILKRTLITRSEKGRTKDESYTDCVQHLRLAISIFFCYLRKHVQSKIFIQHIRNWVLRLTSLLLTSTNLEDYWFLLFHLLRCPGKLAWGVHMIQIPQCALMEHQVFTVNLAVSLLAILLSPVNKRNIYLQEQANLFHGLTDGSSGAGWIVVESDGDEEYASSTEYTRLKEKDLIGLLNQIPFGNLFRFILNISEARNNETASSINEEQFRNVLYFNSKLIKLIAYGLSNLGAEHYSYFIKRLGLLIKHCIHYTYDYYLLFLEQQSNGNLQRERLNIMLDEFALLSCECLYHCRKFGISQFFQFIPYGAIHKSTLYAIFHFLNIGFPDKFSRKADYKTIVESADFLKSTVEKFERTEEEELHFLVQTFFEMAISRESISDFDFIQVVAKHMFAIGCLNETTRSICFKSCKDMLISLTSVYPNLISDIIHITHGSIFSIEELDDIFKGLPLHLWTPDFLALEVISLWLREYSYDTKQNQLARIILERMNWAFKSEDRLFLSRDIHVYVACVVSEAVSKHTSKSTGRIFLIEKLYSIPIIENPISLEEHFIRWCWSFIGRLRLHYLDQGRTIAASMLNNPVTFLLSIPDLNEIELISRGVSEKQPLALLLAIGITKCGHSLPLICQKSFDYLYEMLMSSGYIIVIRYLELLTLMFINNTATLNQCERFLEILYKILESNRIVFNKESPIDLLKDMLHSQIHNANSYGLSSPEVLVEHWFQILLNLSSSNISRILFLLDNILMVTYSIPSAWDRAKKILRSQFEKCEYKSNKFAVRHEFYKYPWYCLCALEVEHELYELNNNLWNSLLLPFKFGSSLKIDEAFNDAIKNVDSHQRRVDALVIFKYANVIVNIDRSHCALPVLAEHFFLLYLCRIEQNSGEKRLMETVGVSDKFYEFDVKLINRIDIQFKAAEEYYANMLKLPGAVFSNLVEHQAELSRLFQTYSIWLKETSINKISEIEHTHMPACFMQERLKDIFCQKKFKIELLKHMIEFEVVGNVQRYHKYCWRDKIHNQEQLPHKNVKRIVKPAERIQNYLNSYDCPQDSPYFPVCISQYATNYDAEKVLQAVNTNLKIFDCCSKKMDVLSEECRVLNGMYAELLSDLYGDIFQEKKEYIKCSFILNPVHKCTKPAEISVTVKKSIKNETIEKNMVTNRFNHFKITNSILVETLERASIAVESLQSLIRQLTISYSNLPDDLKSSSMLLHLCRKVIFQLMDDCYKNILYNDPSRKVWQELFSILKVSTQKYWHKQGPQILEVAINDEILLTILSDTIEPSKIDFKSFIDMYEIIAEAPRKLVDARVWLRIISKFNVEFCLTHFKPRDDDVFRILKCILKSVSNWNGHVALSAVYRKHLINVFQYNFPKYILKILEELLKACSTQCINSSVILDVVSTLLGLNHDETDCEDIYLRIQKFAKKQKQLDLKSTLEAISMYTNFFHKERIKYSSDGLYQFYECYCEHLSILFAIFAHIAVVSTVNNCMDESKALVLGRTFEACMALYTPWVCSYDEYKTTQKTNNYCNHNNTFGLDFSPWKEDQLSHAKHMINSLISTLKFSASVDKHRTVVVSCYFNWYISNYANDQIPYYIQSVVTNEMKCLPWKPFLPSREQLNISRQIVSEGPNEIKMFFTSVFLQIPWKQWYLTQFSFWNFENQVETMNDLLIIIVKLTIENDFQRKELLQIFTKETQYFPWHSVSYEILEKVFHWITIKNTSLKIDLIINNNEISTNFLSILKSASLMNNYDQSKVVYSSQAKRLLYVKSIFNLLLSLISMSHDPPASAVSLDSKLDDFFCGIMTNIEDIISWTGTTKSEGVNLLLIVINILDNLNETSSFILRCVNKWLFKYSNSSIMLLLIIDVIGLKTALNENYYKLLEWTVEQCLRLKVLESDGNHENFTWTFIIDKLATSMNNMNVTNIIHEQCLLVAHILLMHNVRGGEINRSFLTEVIDLLEFIQPNVENEQKLVTLLGALICSEYAYIDTEDNPTTTLLQLGTSIHKLIKPQKWGSMLLGMVGLHQETTSKKFHLLARCLACLVFSMCSEKDFYCSSLEELKALINSKRNLEFRHLLVDFAKKVEEYHSTQDRFNMIFDTISLFYNEPLVRSSKHAWMSISKM